MEEYESISIAEILEELKKHLVLIILLMVIGGLVAAGYTYQTKHITYESSGKLIISKENEALLAEYGYTQSDVALYETISNTYVEIARSNVVLDEVAESIPKYTRDEIAGMVDISAIEDTLILEVWVDGANQAEVYDITQAYMNAIMDQCKLIMPVGNLQILDEATSPYGIASASLIRNTLIGLAAGLIIAFFVVILRMFAASTKIYTSKQAIQYLGLEVQAITL